MAKRSKTDLHISSTEEDLVGRVVWSFRFCLAEIHKALETVENREGMKVVIQC